MDGGWIDTGGDVGVCYDTHAVRENAKVSFELTVYSVSRHCQREHHTSFFVVFCSSDDKAQGTC